MFDSGLFGRITSENLRLPGVEVAIEVDDGDLSVGAIDRPEEREDDGVVSA